jgi:hypothetical protein
LFLNYLNNHFRKKVKRFELFIERFPINKNGLFGRVRFFNLTSASNPSLNQHLGDAFAPEYRIGQRLKMSKQTNTNISIDYGRGKNGAHVIYFNLQEAF